MKTVIFLCFLLYASTLFSQKEDIDHIRNIYTKVSDQISECSSPDNCSLYKNTLKINEMNSSWRAVGNYSKTITFWYTDDPYNCDDCEDMGNDFLQKVTIEEISAAYEYYYEYLYENGQLLFHFYRDEEEYRFYYKDQSLIRYMKGQEIKEDQTDQAGQVLSESKRLMDLYLASF